MPNRSGVSWSGADTALVLVPIAAKVLTQLLGLYLGVVTVLYAVETHIYPGSVTTDGWLLIAAGGSLTMVLFVAVSVVLAVLKPDPVVFP